MFQLIHLTFGIFDPISKGAQGNLHTKAMMHTREPMKGSNSNPSSHNSSPLVSKDVHTASQSILSTGKQMNQGPKDSERSSRYDSFAVGELMLPELPIGGLLQMNQVVVSGNTSVTTDGVDLLKSGLHLMDDMNNLDDHQSNYDHLIRSYVQNYLSQPAEKDDFIYQSRQDTTNPNHIRQSELDSEDSRWVDEERFNEELPEDDENQVDSLKAEDYEDASEFDHSNSGQIESNVNGILVKWLDSDREASGMMSSYRRNGTAMNLMDIDMRILEKEFVSDLSQHDLTDEDSLLNFVNSNGNDLNDLDGLDGLEALVDISHSLKPGYALASSENDDHFEKNMAQAYQATVIRPLYSNELLMNHENYESQAQAHMNLDNSNAADAVNLVNTANASEMARSDMGNSLNSLKSLRDSKLIVQMTQSSHETSVVNAEVESESVSNSDSDIPVKSHHLLGHLVSLAGGYEAILRLPESHFTLPTRISNRPDDLAKFLVMNVENDKNEKDAHNVHNAHMKFVLDTKLQHNWTPGTQLWVNWKSPSSKYQVGRVSHLTVPQYRWHTSIMKDYEVCCENRRRLMNQASLQLNLFVVFAHGLVQMGQNSQNNS